MKTLTSISFKRFFIFLAIFLAIFTENLLATSQDEKSGPDDGASVQETEVQSGDWRTRLAAVRRLTEEQKEQAIPALLRMAAEDPDPIVASEAAASAGSFQFAGNEHEVTDAFLKIFDQRREVQVRYAVLLSLHALQDSDRAKEILVALETVEKETNDPVLQDLAKKLVTDYRKE